MEDVMVQFNKDMEERGYSNDVCEIFYSIMEYTFSFQLSLGCECKYAFSDDTYVVNPFYDETGRFSVNPVSEFNEAFLNSNYIDLLDKIKEYLNQFETITDDIKNLCIAINIAEIEEYTINDYIKFLQERKDCKLSKEKILDDILKENEEYMIYLSLNGKIIINPFKNNKVIKEYEDIYNKSKFADLTII